MFDIKKSDSNLIALKKFFGLRQGQTLKEFKAEIDQLSLESQQELGDLIREQHGRAGA